MARRLGSNGNRSHPSDGVFIGKGDDRQRTPPGVVESEFRSCVGGLFATLRKQGPLTTPDLASAGSASRPERHGGFRPKADPQTG